MEIWKLLLLLLLLQRTSTDGRHRNKNIDRPENIKEENYNLMRVRLEENQKFGRSLEDLQEAMMNDGPQREFQHKGPRNTTKHQFQPFRFQMDTGDTRQNLSDHGELGLSTNYLITTPGFGETLLKRLRSPLDVHVVTGVKEMLLRRAATPKASINSSSKARKANKKKKMRFSSKKPANWTGPETGNPRDFLSRRRRSFELHFNGLLAAPRVKGLSAPATLTWENWKQVAAEEDLRADYATDAITTTTTTMAQRKQSEAQEFATSRLMAQQFPIPIRNPSASQRSNYLDLVVSRGRIAEGQSWKIHHLKEAAPAIISAEPSQDWPLMGHWRRSRPRLLHVGHHSVAHQGHRRVQAGHRFHHYHHYHDHHRKPPVKPTSGIASAARWRLPVATRMKTPDKWKGIGQLGPDWYQYHQQRQLTLTSGRTTPTSGDASATRWRFPATTSVKAPVPEHYRFYGEFHGSAVGRTNSPVRDFAIESGGDGMRRPMTLVNIARSRKPPATILAKIEPGSKYFMAIPGVVYGPSMVHYGRAWPPKARPQTTLAAITEDKDASRMAFDRPSTSGADWNPPPEASIPITSNYLADDRGNVDNATAVHQIDFDDAGNAPTALLGMHYIADRNGTQYGGGDSGERKALLGEAAQMGQHRGGATSPPEVAKDSFLHALDNLDAARLVFLPAYGLIRPNPKTLVLGDGHEHLWQLKLLPLQEWDEDSTEPQDHRPPTSTGRSAPTTETTVATQWRHRTVLTAEKAVADVARYRSTRRTDAQFTKGAAAAEMAREGVMNTAGVGTADDASGNCFSSMSYVTWMDYVLKDLTTQTFIAVVLLLLMIALIFGVCCTVMCCRRTRKRDSWNNDVNGSLLDIRRAVFRLPYSEREKLSKLMYKKLVKEEELSKKYFGGIGSTFSKQMDFNLLFSDLEKNLNLSQPGVEGRNETANTTQANIDLNKENLQEFLFRKPMSQ